MADSKTSDLSSADPNGNLVLYVVDTDESAAADQSKKILFGTLVDSIVTIDGGVVVNDVSEGP